LCVGPELASCVHKAAACVGVPCHGGPIVR
jgi:hypothetical protein